MGFIAGIPDDSIPFTTSIPVLLVRAADIAEPLEEGYLVPLVAFIQTTEAMDCLKRVDYPLLKLVPT